MITKKDLERCQYLSQNAGYNYFKKIEFRRLSRKIFKYIVKKLQLTNYEIRWNEGGEAVSGDNILHDERFYLTLNDFYGQFYFRSCNGLKDYSGGNNHMVSWNSWIHFGLDHFIEELAEYYYPERLELVANGSGVAQN